VTDFYDVVTEYSVSKRQISCSEAFSVKISYGRAPTIKEVIWQPPVFNWIKCNVDGASEGNPGPASCGGFYRDKNGAFMGAFAYNLGISNSLFAELNGAMYAIELACQKVGTICG
jgi:hypothetical protein